MANRHHLETQRLLSCSRWHPRLLARLFAALLLIAATAAPAAELAYPYLYRDPRALAMGNAQVAVGGLTGSSFYNPAGIGRLERGFTVELVPLTLAMSDGFDKFAEELDDALDIDDEFAQRRALNELITRYRGRNLHGRADTLPTLAWRGERNAVSLQFLGALRADARLHQGFGSDGVFAVDLEALFGPAVSFAHERGPLVLGIGGKFLERQRLARHYSIREIVDISSSNGRGFGDDKQSATAAALDLGAIYRLPALAGWSVSLGAAALNIGDLDFGEAGRIPATLNLGVAAQRSLAGIERVTLALDYVDALHAYPQDDDLVKRLHLGVEARLWNYRWSSFALRTGVSQGHYTAGAELRLGVLALAFSTYAEEMGAYGGQDGSRRYVASLVLGW